MFLTKLSLTAFSIAPTTYKHEISHNHLQLLQLLLGLLAHVSPTIAIRALFYVSLDHGIEGVQLAQFVKVVDDRGDGEVSHGSLAIVPEVLETGLAQEGVPSTEARAQMHRWSLKELGTSAESFRFAALQAIVQDPVLILNVHVVGDP